MDVHEMRAQGLRCKQASYALAQLCTEKKDAALERMAAVLWDARETILEANRQDVEQARAAGRSDSFIDRLARMNNG